MSKPDFWQDRERAVEVSREAENEEKEINKWEDLKQKITELEQLVAERSEKKILAWQVKRKKNIMI